MKKTFDRKMLMIWSVYGHSFIQCTRKMSIGKNGTYK